MCSLAPAAYGATEESPETFRCGGARCLTLTLPDGNYRCTARVVLASCDVAVCARRPRRGIRFARDL